MAGRGRGRGRGAPDLGTKAEQAGHDVEPPPTYPPLAFKPLPSPITPEQRYLLHLKKGFADYMHESLNSVKPIIVKKDIERYSDKYAEVESKKYDERYDWSRLPALLKSTVKKKRRGTAKSSDSKAKKHKEDITIKLEELESKEETDQSDAEEEKKEADEDKDDDEIENDVSDEEMDDGTDYVNNYFDNGEAYEDEDDKANDEEAY